jgi:hypothetical protein
VLDMVPAGPLVQFAVRELVAGRYGGFGGTGAAVHASRVAVVDKNG